MKSKYIIVEEYGGLELPIVFSPLLEHANVARNFNKVISAGFCSRNQNGTFSVFGKSIGLGISSRPEDIGILFRNLERNI